MVVTLFHSQTSQSLRVTVNDSELAVESSDIWRAGCFLILCRSDWSLRTVSQTNQAWRLMDVRSNQMKWWTENESNDPLCLSFTVYSINPHTQEDSFPICCLMLMIAKIPKLLLYLMCRGGRVPPDEGVSQCIDNRKPCQGMLPGSFLRSWMGSSQKCCSLRPVALSQSVSPQWQTRCPLRWQLLPSRPVVKPLRVFLCRKCFDSHRDVKKKSWPGSLCVCVAVCIEVPVWPGCDPPLTQLALR